MPAPHKQNPFDLRDDQAYREWRDNKLAAAPGALDEMRISVDNLSRPDKETIQAIRTACQRANWAIFRVNSPQGATAEALRTFGGFLGLHRIDHNLCAEGNGITVLTARELKGKSYIPYTNRPLSWHTDGYYNSPATRIRSWILFCAQDAAEGGANGLVDHELVYLHLRDRDPQLVASLMAEDAMTIPANEVDGEEIRPPHAGPVFSVDSDGNLHMRYSARKRNIIWKDNPDTRAAAEAIESLLSGTTAPIFHYRLKPGEGIVSNNVLHRRHGFRDDPDTGRQRLFYRARYYDRIPDTGTRTLGETTCFI